MQEDVLIIQRAVAAHYHLPVEVHQVRDRHQALVKARHLAIWVTRELTPLSLEQIGRAFDRSDKAVHFAVRSVQDQISTSRTFHDEAVALRYKCATALEQRSKQASA